MALSYNRREANLGGTGTERSISKGRVPVGEPETEGQIPQSTRVTTPASRVLGLTVVDQGASSLSNFALALLVAHYSQARALGIFAILTVTYVIAQGFVRSVSSDCLLTRHETSDAVMERFERSGYLCAFGCATAIAVPLLVASAFLPSDFAVPFAIFAVCFPFMALQDFARFVGISRHRPGYAIWLDSAWVVLFVAAAVLLIVNDMTSLSWLWASWTGAGAVVGLWTIHAHRIRGGLRALSEPMRFWLASERSVGIRFAGQFLLSATWIYFIYYPLLFVLSVGDVGVIKLAQLVLGPITVLAAGMQSALVSLAARRFRADRASALRFCALCGLAIALATTAWTAIVYFLPIHQVTRVFGPTWPAARVVFPWMGLAFVFGSFSGMAVGGLRAIRAAAVNLWLAVVMLPISFALCLGGAAAHGVLGFSYGMAATFAIYAVFGWIALIAAARRFVPAPAEEADAGTGEVDAGPAGIT
jgi:O-antigen/teichoic acid export membrane protein